MGVQVTFEGYTEAAVDDAQVSAWTDALGELGGHPSLGTRDLHRGTEVTAYLTLELEGGLEYHEVAFKAYEALAPLLTSGVVERSLALGEPEPEPTPAEG